MFIYDTHIHDDEYYTKSEIINKLNSKINIPLNYNNEEIAVFNSVGELSSDDVKILAMGWDGGIF